MRVTIALNGKQVTPDGQQGQKGQLVYPVWWVPVWWVPVWWNGNDTDDDLPEWLRIFGAMLLGCLLTSLAVLVGSRFGWDIMAMIVLGGLALALGWVLFRSSQNRGRQNKGQQSGWVVYW